MNYFLLSAYLFTGGLLGYYFWSVRSRKRDLQRELERLASEEKKDLS